MYLAEPSGQQAGSLTGMPADANYPSPALPFWGSRRREIDAKFLHKVKCFWRKGARVKLAVNEVGSWVEKRRLGGGGEVWKFKWRQQ